MNEETAKLMEYNEDRKACLFCKFWKKKEYMNQYYCDFAVNHHRASKEEATTSTIGTCPHWRYSF